MIAIWLAVCTNPYFVCIFSHRNQSTCHIEQTSVAPRERPKRNIVAPPPGGIGLSIGPIKRHSTAGIATKPGEYTDNALIQLSDNVIR